MATTDARPTLEMVARAAGVSKATASKVLNGRHDVAADTRERVQAVMESLRYAPTTGRRPSRPSVTVLFDAFVNLYSAQVLSGMVAAAAELDVDVVITDLASTDGEPKLTREWFRSLAAQGRTGVIVVTTELGPPRVPGLGLVAIDPVSIDPASAEELVSVSATNWSGGLQATEHLLQLGHRRIGFAGGPAASRPAQQRLHGHLAALANWQVPPDRSLLLQRSFSYEGGREMALELLSSAEPPTAIVAGCDASALGVMEAARSRHLQLPEELSIVGFDDTYAAEWTSPQLTTVRQPMREMGRLALRTLLAAAEGQRPDTHHFELATTLVVRSSTTRAPR